MALLFNRVREIFELCWRDVIFLVDIIFVDIHFSSAFGH